MKRALTRSALAAVFSLLIAHGASAAPADPAAIPNGGSTPEVMINGQLYVPAAVKACPSGKATCTSSSDCSSSCKCMSGFCKKITQ